MRQHKYQLINTVRISVKEEFHWVKCPSSIDPDRSCLLQSYATNSAQTILESVRWEIDKLLPLSHPHLQSVIDVFATTDSLHIVQELEKWECAINRVPYTPAQAKSLLQEIIPVLSYLHDRGITHGNISHETILVDDLDRHVLTNFLAIADLITEVGGDTYPRLRSQLDLIPVKNMPTGREWDLYSLGVTTIALLTDRDYQYLYDPNTKKWEWESYVDCSEELTKTIDRLLGQEKKPRREKIASSKEPIDKISNLDVGQDNFQPEHPQEVSTFFATSSGRISPNLYRSIIGLLLFSILGLASYLVWGKDRESNLTDPQLQSFPQNGTLTVGYLNRTPSRDRSPAQKRDYPKFQAYLETELRKQYGQNIKVNLESAITGQEARDNIKQKKWDVVFAASATNSLVAEDNKYEFIARMSANEDPYRDVCLFVMKDSKIESIKDFTPEVTIALPNEDSPLFTMSLYDLYGKKIRVSFGNTLSKIQEKVKSAEADIGVDYCKLVAKNPQFRSLSPNRIIPVGGVFLSPKIEKTADRERIEQALTKAPDNIQLGANYTRSAGINYTQFRRINDRATQLLNCVDFTRNPVDFYCNKPPQNIITKP